MLHPKKHAVIINRGASVKTIEVWILLCCIRKNLEFVMKTYGHKFQIIFPETDTSDNNM